METSLDPILIAETIASSARQHEVASILHVGVQTGLLGAALRHQLDYAHGRLEPTSWQAHITGQVESGQAVPFGHCYDTIEALPQHQTPAESDDQFDLVLAPRVSLELARKEAGEQLRRLYSRARTLLITTAHNDLLPQHDPLLEDRYTIQLLSADFPRVRFIDLGCIALAIIKNEFLPL